MSPAGQDTPELGLNSSVATCTGELPQTEPPWIPATIRNPPVKPRYIGLNNGGIERGTFVENGKCKGLCLSVNL